ncbi:hypothetical protein JCM4814A_94700 [Streptomyces phaeofaciens JCM 4814]|uniref:Uncharacterized protein n=1 Tax=Streptomyces phaeofaciens TaxID=68254 RepID=A0A918M0S9_9ACTN|nr:hypothetical protein GCM10010226_88440 [Streptomyces phaeofaciens]
MTAHRAELSAHVDQSLLPGAPVFPYDLLLPDSWREDLTGTLGKVAAADTDLLRTAAVHGPGDPHVSGHPGREPLDSRPRADLHY